MYTCKQCGTGNPLDSSFCKKCGSALPENELADARVKLNEMLEEGNNLFTDGRTDEAMLIAEAAVSANPSSHLAQSLKGLCHERVGEVAEALECYEAAVSLNPDSSLDKVKVAALRNRLAQRVADHPEPSRRSAAIIAGAAMVVVLVLGCLVAIGMNSRRDPAKLASNTPATTQQTLPTFQAPTQDPNTSPTNTAQAPTATTAPTNQPAANTNTGRIPELPSSDAGALPPAGSNFGYAPVPMGPIGETNQQNAPAKPTQPPVDVPPAQLPSTSDGDKKGADTTPPPEDQGQMTIEKSGGKKHTLGGSESASDGHDVATVLQAAQVLYQLGHFDQAASKYSRVAELGANSGRVQQRIGDCYRNLGKTGESRTAYNHAISLYQSQIKQGRDVAGNQRGLDSCESALKVLGG